MDTVQTLDPIPDLICEYPKHVSEQLKKLSQQLRQKYWADTIWSRLLSQQERDYLTVHGGTGDVILTYAALRRMRPVQAVARLAYELDLLSEAEHRWLLIDLGEPSDHSEVGKPEWNADRGELRLNGDLIMVVKGNGDCMSAILNRFQELGWPERIDDPNPIGPDSQSLRETIGRMNRKQNRIRFLSRRKGVRWEIRFDSAKAAHQP